MGAMLKFIPDLKHLDYHFGAVSKATSSAFLQSLEVGGHFDGSRICNFKQNISRHFGSLNFEC